MSLEASEDAIFVHFPLLALPAGSIDLLDGRLGEIPYEVFALLDRDWAHRGRFERVRPVFWCSPLPPQTWERRQEDEDALLAFMKTIPPGTATREQQGAIGELIEKAYFAPITKEREEATRRKEEDADLIFLALLAATGGRPFPDPRLSMLYTRSSKGGRDAVSRLFHRTYLLNSEPHLPLASEELALLVRIASSWRQAGLAAADGIFAPLRAISVSSGFDPQLAVLPLAVALEGYVLPENVRGIAVEIARRARKLLGRAAPPDLDAGIRRLYAIRSDIVHGRPLATAPQENLAGWARALLVQITLAAVEKLTFLSTDLEGLQAWLRSR